MAGRPASVGENRSATSMDLFGPAGDNRSLPTGERRVMGYRRRDWVAIIGEADHQDVLRRLLDQQGRHMLASLVPEPEPTQGPNAIAVAIDGQTVGYLSPELARTYGGVLSSSETARACPATLNGGEWDQPYLTVLLDFSRVYTAARDSCLREEV
jgi:hypothetical protein